MDNLQFHISQLERVSEGIDAAMRAERKRRREEQDRKQIALVSLRTTMSKERGA